MKKYTRIHWTENNQTREMIYDPTIKLMVQFEAAANRYGWKPTLKDNPVTGMIWIGWRAAKNQGYTVLTFDQFLDVVSEEIEVVDADGNIITVTDIDQEDEPINPTPPDHTGEH